MSTLPDQSENVPSAPTSEEVAPRSSSAASPSPATPATKTIVSTEKDVSVDAAGADEYKLEQTKTKTSPDTDTVATGCPHRLSQIPPQKRKQNANEIAE